MRSDGGSRYCTHDCTIARRKLFISRSCPILVLTTVLSLPRRADFKKYVKNYQGTGANYFPRKCDSKILKFQHTFFFFKYYSNYDLNLGRYLNPELPPMRDFATRILGKYCTFVCGTLFGE
jgi:hypothetical protein